MRGVFPVFFEGGNNCSSYPSVIILFIISKWIFSRRVTGHGANIYLAGRLLGSVTYNSSIKHTSCMKVRFWVSSRRARVGASEASVLFVSRFF